MNTTTMVHDCLEISQVQNGCDDGSIVSATSTQSDILYESSAALQRDIQVEDCVQTFLRDTQYVALEIPAQLLAALEKLSATRGSTSVDTMAYLVAQALVSQQSWSDKLNQLRDLIQQEGGLDVSDDNDMLVEHIRQIRRDIFETEYDGYWYR